MQFLRNHWYHVAGIVFVALAFFMGFFNMYLSQIQIILIYSFMAILAHQFEEYVFPAGGPIVLNKGQWGEKENFIRFPANMQSCMVINLTAWLIYGIAIVFSQFIWLGLATMFFSCVQFIAHGFIWNRGMKTWYNAGLATSVFLLVPISVYYMFFVYTNNLATMWDWICGAIAAIGIMLVTVVIPTQSLKNPNSSYPFPQWQVDQSEKVRQFATLRKEI